MASLNDLARLREQADELRRQADRAAGARDQALGRLDAEFGCKSVAEGRKLLAKLQREERAAKEAFDEAFDAFETKHGRTLGQA